MARSSIGELKIVDPPIAESLFSSVRWSWIWLFVRIYLGYTWLTSGIGKLTNPAWMVTGTALKSFWERAIVIPEAPARPAIAFDWYRMFIQFLLNSQSYVWFAKLIAISETLIGIALILGLFTGVAAFLGGFMNWNFMMAGSASINPVLFTLSIFVVLAWKTAGWWGLDRWLLPLLGTPWQPGRVFSQQESREGKET
jgi:thiosulfate dehydrogenase [quinone] large subunit